MKPGNIFTIAKLGVILFVLVPFSGCVMRTGSRSYAASSGSTNDGQTIILVPVIIPQTPPSDNPSDDDRGRLPERNPPIESTGGRQPAPSHSPVEL